MWWNTFCHGIFPSSSWSCQCPCGCGTVVKRYIIIWDWFGLVQVGIAGLLIASKYEEVYGPAVKEFEFICDGAYTRQAILNMERLMLKTLGFQFTVPTTFTFLTRYVKAAGYARFTQVCRVFPVLISLLHSEAFHAISDPCLQYLIY